MPPRSAKKATGATAVKKAPGKTPTKSPKSAAKDASVEMNENQKKDVEMTEKRVEEVEAEEPKSVDKTEADENQPKEDPPSNGSAPKPDVEDVPKASYDEDDKDERLELDDNDPESEPEEEEPAGMMDADEDEPEEEEMDDHYEEPEGGEGGEDGEGDHEDGGEGDEDGIEIESEGEEEHHEVVKERRKRKEFEVFVGGLDKDANEDDLKKVFSEVGEVTEIRLLMNPQTQKNKGFAFIRFATVDQAKRACTELKNVTVRGKTCGVSPSQDSDTLFVGNICKTWTKEALKDKLKQYGIENIEELTLVEDTNNEGMNRGFAFLEFSNRTDAMNAFKRLQRRDVILGTDRTAKVSFAETFVEPDEEVMAQVTTIFIDGMPPSWDEDRVKESLKKHKEIEKVHLARNMPSAKRRDFGFITFSTHDAAVACIEDVNANGLGEGDDKVKVKARLCKPNQKGRLHKHGFRGGFRVGRPPARAPWSRLPPPFESRRFSSRGGRYIGRGSSFGGRGFKRPVRRSDLPPPRLPSRFLPPAERVRDRRPPPPPVYPRSSSRRDFPRRDEPYDDRLPRSRRSAEFSTRTPPAPPRRSSYRDAYEPRGPPYAEPSPPRGISRTARRPSYPAESYTRRVEKPYREAVSGSKRPFSAMEEAAARYEDPAIRHSRARPDYGVSGGASQYGGYGESARMSRGSQMGYGSSRQESYGLYDGRHSGMGYGGGSMGSGEAGVYSTYNDDYLPSGGNVGGSSYSSLYSSRGASGGGYMSGGGSGSFY